MTKRTFPTPPTASRVLAVALLALTGVAHGQKPAPRDLPPYLPPESSSAADNAENTNAKQAAGAKSEAEKTPAPRVLAPRDDAKTETTRTQATSSTTTASGKKLGGTARRETANGAAKTSGKVAASTRGGAAPSTQSIAPATLKSPKLRALDGGDGETMESAAAPKRAPLAPAARAANGAAIVATRGAMTTFSAGALPPSQLPFRQLGEGWQRVTIVAPTLTAAPKDASTRATQNVMAQHVAQLYGGDSGVFFTRGETLQTGSETFLALYKMRVSPVEIAAIVPKGAGNADAATRALTAFFANRPLELSLVNVRNIGAIRDIKPFSQIAQTTQLRAILDDAPATSPGSISAGATSLPAPAPPASTRGSAYYASLARTNLLRLGGALDLYARAHGGTLPPLQNFAVAHKALLPYAGRLAFTHPAPGAHFVFNPILSGRKIVHIAQPRDMISAYEVPPSGAKRAVLFLNGTVRFLDAAQWRKYSRGSKIK